LVDRITELPTTINDTIKKSLLNYLSLVSFVPKASVAASYHFIQFPFATRGTN